MRSSRRIFLLGSAGLCAASLLSPAHAKGEVFAFPLPDITGGQGGKDRERGRIIRVTTLSPEGPGSITEAVRSRGPRIVAFEVGGVIDLGLKTLRISNGDLTLAGQTAPAPGITFIRGGIAIGEGCENVIIQHVAVRPGEAGQAKGSGWECDGIYTYAASRILVSNCSITWATDEGLSASGPRFDGGDDVSAWRAHTSRDIVFRDNIVAESLSNSTHSKGEHSKGTLIHDNVRNVRVEGSLYAHNVERNVLFKGGASGLVRGNVVYNPGRRFTHMNLNAGDWDGHAWEATQAEIIENIFLAGPSTPQKAAAFTLGGEGPLDLTMRDNLALDSRGGPLPQFARSGAGTAELVDRLGEGARVNPPDTARLRVLMDEVLARCGARPWDRDPIDARIVADVRGGTGRIIDSEADVGGYPVRPESHAAFVEAHWNLATMTRA